MKHTQKLRSKHPAILAVGIASLFIALSCASSPAAVTYVGEAILDGTGTDHSGLPSAVLEDAVSPQNGLNGIGSGFTHAGGNLFYSLPDRGPNKVQYSGGAGVDYTTSFANRVQQFTLSFTPVGTPDVNGHYASYTVGATNVGTALLKNASGVQYQGISTGYTNGTRLDCEGIRVAPDGSFWVSDEYGPFLLHFNSAGQQIGSLALPQGFEIANPNSVGTTETANNTVGRVTNKGMEGLAISPDGKTLVGIMQSPLIQDGGGSGTNVRILVYDLTNPSAAPKQYLYQLDSTSLSNSEILAINNHKFLIDERNGSSGAAGIKKLYQIDLNQATPPTDLAASAYPGTTAANGMTPINGTPSGVVPLAKTLFADIGSILTAANAFTTDSANFKTDLPDKIEGYSWGPDLPDGRHLLLVTNDNDFVQPFTSAGGATTGKGYPNYIFALAVDAADVPDFQPQAFDSAAVNTIDHIVVVYQENWSFDGLYGSFPGANGRGNASGASLTQLDRLTGNPLANNTTGNFNIATRTSPTLQNPNPQPIDTNSGNIVDTRFSSTINTLLPFDVSASVAATATTGDIVHKYFQEMYQIYGSSQDGTDHGNNSGFVTWSDNPGLVMSYYDATNLPEGLLAQQYTMCDNFFHSAFGGSFLNHQFFIAAAPPVYPSMPALNNGAIAYLDGSGLFALNTSGSSTGKVIRDGSITPVFGDVLSGLTINGVSGQSATVGSSGTPSDISFQDGSHFDKHYIVNTSFSRNMAATFNSFATAATGNLTSGSTTVSGVAVTAGGALTGAVGMTVSGAGIPAGTIVTAATGSSVTLSQAASASASGVALSFTGYPVSLIPSQDNTTTPMNIGDVLDSVGVSWKWYSGGWNNALDSSPSNPLHLGSTGPNTVSSLFQWHHQAFAFFEKSKPFDGGQPDGRNPYATAHIQDEANLYTDITNNTLPAVSFVKFLGPDNEHPGYASLQQGQAHVASLIQALQANPSLWAHTAVIITYDEHGGRWDHVTPPVRDLWGPGVRVPCIVISPLAKKGYVDHAQRDTSSILSTIEQRFGAPALNQRDATAPNFFDVFTALDIARGAYVVNRRANAITQSVTITNRSATTMAGPVQLVLDNLPGTTTLVNKTGVTSNNAPNGSPYITATAGSLAPGASVTVSLQFIIPASGGVNYYARTVTGTANP